MALIQTREQTERQSPVLLFFLAAALLIHRVNARMTGLNFDTETIDNATVQKMKRAETPIYNGIGLVKI